MARSASPLPEAFGSGFSAAQARAAGVGARRLSQNDVIRVASGLYLRDSSGAPEGAAEHQAAAWRRLQLEHALALGACLRSGVFFSGRTAAVLWELPVPADPRPALEVSCFAPSRAPRRAGLLAHKVEPHLARVVEHRGVMVTDPVSTWAMLAHRLAIPDGIALGDAVIRAPRIPGTARLKRPPLAGLEDLASAAILRRPGADRLRAMIPLLSTQSASAPETHLRLLIREWGLPEPQLDHDVYDSTGRLLGCSEIVFPRYRLAMEYEGGHHLTDARQWNRDIDKYSDYAAAGWETLRVTASLLYQQRPSLRYRW